MAACFVLAAGAAAAQDAAATEPACAAEAARCGEAVRADCVERLGAGAIAADDPSCGAELAAYRACLGAVANRCGAPSAQRQEPAGAAAGEGALRVCAQVLSALRPLLEKAGPEGRARVAAGPADGRYSLPAYFYRVSAGTAGFDVRHGPTLQRWREAAVEADLFLPESFAEDLAYFDDVVVREIERGAFMSRDEMGAWLERLSTRSDGFKARCRGLAR